MKKRHQKSSKVTRGKNNKKKSPKVTRGKNPTHAGPLPPRCLDIIGAAHYLNVRPNFIRYLIVTSQIGHLLAGKKYIVAVEELDRWEARQRVPAAVEELDSYVDRVKEAS